MGESVHVELPRKEFGDDLAQTLASHGFDAEVVDEEGRYELHVSYTAAEKERLLEDVANVIESWLGDRMMPLVVERADGHCVLRPPAE
jgi:hypothetical protein